MADRPCVAHHHACDCREEYFAAMAERTKNRSVEIANSERDIRELGDEVDRLRAALIKVGRAAGAFLADDVS